MHTKAQNTIALTCSAIATYAAHNDVADNVVQDDLVHCTKALNDFTDRLNYAKLYEQLAMLDTEVRDYFARVLELIEDECSASTILFS